MLVSRRTVMGLIVMTSATLRVQEAEEGPEEEGERGKGAAVGIASSRRQHCSGGGCVGTKARAVRDQWEQEQGLSPCFKIRLHYHIQYHAPYRIPYHMLHRFRNTVLTTFHTTCTTPASSSPPARPLRQHLAHCHERLRRTKRKHA